MLSARAICWRISAILAVVLGVSSGIGVAQNQRAVPGWNFQGRFLVVASDTDMLASAYMNGRLGPLAGPDALSVIRLDQPPSALKPVGVAITNSVTGPPASVALTPDGRFAVVIETQGPRPDQQPDAVLNDLAPGRAITVVDLANPDQPRIIQQIQGYENPLSVSVNADGTLVAVALGIPPKTKQPHLVLYRLRKGQLSAPSTPDIPGFAPDDALISAEFHPKNGSILGLVYNRHPRLAFVQVNTTRDGVALSAWGAAVPVDPGPFLVRFTADGQYALVNAMYIGADIRGTVASIKVDSGQAPNGAPQHVMISRVDTGAAPEGLAVSPDSRWVATTNLERSAYPIDDPHQGYFSSVTLLRLDPQTGSLGRVGEFPFDGILPEAAVFDNTSRYLAVTNYGFFDAAKPGGTIDFWRIAGDYADPRRTELVKTGYSVPVPRGPQSMVIAR